MSDKELPILDFFSPVLIQEYIRLMTAVYYIQSEDKSGSCKFSIKPEHYNQIINHEVKGPLTGLTLNYDETQNILTVRGNEHFIKSYENKIQEEVSLKFAQENTQRYSKFISLAN